tara:strand:+ start:2613 stop:3464 length:852 start_codon:yes stop_codon:yes gene_type:complete
MGEPEQFRFTPDIQKNFKKTLNELKDDGLINKLKLTINYLTAVEEELKRLEGLKGTEHFIDPEIIPRLKHNLTLGHNEAIGIIDLKKQDLDTTDANSEKPGIVSPELKKMSEVKGGGTFRASVDEKFMKHYINEYKRVDTTILSVLDTLMKLVEKIYQDRTLDISTENDLVIHTITALDRLGEIFDIICEGSQNQEQVYLLVQHQGKFPNSIYFTIKQLFIDIFKYITTNTNYLDDANRETYLKTQLRDWYGLWKNNLIMDNKATDDDFTPQGKYAEIQQLFN